MAEVASTEHSDQHIIQIREVWKTYKMGDEEVHALRGVTLDVFRGEVGIAPERLTAIGHGEFKPLVPNDTEENRAANRRVEIKIRHQQDSEDSSEELIKQLIEEADLGVVEKPVPEE